MDNFFDHDMHHHNILSDELQKQLQGLNPLQDQGYGIESHDNDAGVSADDTGRYDDDAVNTYDNNSYGYSDDHDQHADVYDTGSHDIGHHDLHNSLSHDIQKTEHHQEIGYSDSLINYGYEYHATPLEPKSEELEFHAESSHTVHTHINSHHLSCHSSYSKAGGSPQITVKDDVVYRHNIDGTKTKVGIVTHESDRHYIYSYDNGYKGELLCNIDLNGNIHHGKYTSVEYMGHVSNGKIYSGNDNNIGYCDSNVEGAAHLVFIGN